MARKRKAANPSNASRRLPPGERQAEVRIIGGQFRGRRLRYHGDKLLRPMKHRTREAIFNLITTEAKGRHAIDLFAGTGALGLEALSRGAVGATFIERHVPSARILEENVRSLGVEDRAQVLVTSAFLWAKRDLPQFGRSIPAGDRTVEASETTTDSIVRPRAEVPWLVFCSPPYAFYVDRHDEMLDLVGRVQQQAPPGTVMVVEADQRLDFARLPPRPAADEPPAWDVRHYRPAVIGVWRRPSESQPRA